jgi:O-antigen/teichoic acid export membrane protein
MAVLSMLQGILVVRLVGMEGLGLVTIITTLTSNIYRLLSFRMSEVVVRFLGSALEQQETRRAAAIVRWAVRVEAGISITAFVILAALSPWAVQIFGLNPGSHYLIILYGIVLLGNLTYESSTGVLQSLRKFDRLAKINIGQSLLTAGIILAAFLTRQSVLMVLVAYLAGKIFAGLAVSFSAKVSLDEVLGKNWWHSRAGIPGEGRKLFLFAMNTNLNGTVNLLVRDNIPLLLGAFRPQTEVGYFKLALSIINLVMLPVEPLIWPTYTEITRTIAARQWSVTRRLLQRVSLIAAAWTILAGGFVALFGRWLIPLVYKPASSPAYPAFLLLLIGYGFANILNWNRPLLLALGKPGFPLIAAALVGLVEIGLTLWLVPQYGYLVQSAILSGFFVVSISIVVWRGLSEIHTQEKLARLSEVAGGTV